MPGIAFSLFRAGIATMISTIKQTNERMQAVMASRIVRMPDFCSANRRDCSEPSWDGFMIRDKQASPPVMTAGECVQVDQQPFADAISSIAFLAGRTRHVEPVRRSCARPDDQSPVVGGRVGTEDGGVIGDGGLARTELAALRRSGGSRGR